MIAELETQIEALAQALIALDPHSPQFRDKLQAISAAGDTEVSQAAAMSGRLAERPAQAMERGPIAGASSVARSLADLRAQIVALDPAQHGDLTRPRKFLGLIPLRSPLAGYLARYAASQAGIQEVLQSLQAGREALERDNAGIEEEIAVMSALMQRIEQYLYVLKGVDRRLESKALELATGYPQKARVLREEVLFDLRRKITDLRAQMAVNAQGTLALELIRRTNLELINGVQRATTTTLAALRTAVTVAQALNKQELARDDVAALTRAFREIYETMDVVAAALEHARQSSAATSSAARSPERTAPSM